MAIALEQARLHSLEESDYLPSRDTGCNDMSALSSPTNCPSLSDSFLSNSTAIGVSDMSRRPSMASSATSNSPDWRYINTSNVTSPTTPTLNATFMQAQPLKCEQAFSPIAMYNLAPFGLEHTDTWDNQDALQAELPHMSGASTMQLMGALGMTAQSHACQGYNPYSQSMSVNPSLSRSIFGIEETTQALTLSKTDHLWKESVTTSPLQTIVPSTAFQPVLTSSPIPKQEPSTPRRTEAFNYGMLSSSPFALLSPPILPSQHEVDELPYDVADIGYSRHQSPAVSDYWTTAVTSNKKYGRPTMHRRGYERKRHVGPSYKPRPAAGRSGINCDAIIPSNEFACSFEGCTDKDGLQKRFKRQEHKKRHEKTVHEKGGSYKCWVPTCKTGAFSRSDNLNSHLKNTHGRKSANQRNDYIATQDRHSPYYDPDYRGPFSKDGYPVSPDQVSEFDI